MAALDLGLKAGVKDLKSLSPKVLYLLGADDAEVLKANIPPNVFVIYQGQIFHCILTCIRTLMLQVLNLNIIYNVNRRK